MLAAHTSAADAHRVHEQYLKGSVYCGHCGSRMIVTHAKNRHGSIYPYFVCAGRDAKRTDCTRRAVLIEDVERRIEEYYSRVGLTPSQRESLTGMLSEEFDRPMAGEADKLAALTKQRDRLENEQTKLMQAHYADAKAILARCLDLLDNLADLYARSDDPHPAAVQPSVLTKIYLEEDNELRPEHTQPFGLLLGPQIHASALTWAKTPETQER